MEEILKRLELIKTCVSLEDEELITMQVQKLQTLAIDEKVKQILALIITKRYQYVIQLIEQYKQDNSGLILYADPQIQGLKLELKALENQLQQLSEQKNDYILEIDQFNLQHNLKLGDILQKFLNLKKTILQQKILVKETLFKSKKEAYENYKNHVEQTKEQAENLKEILDAITDELSDEYYQTYQQYEEIKESLYQQEQILDEKRNEAKDAKEELEEDPINQEYQEAKEDFESFEQDYKTFIAEDSYDLDKEQQKALKIAYRKACWLCHPDIVADDELKEKAHKIMVELNVAKKKNDLTRVQEILTALESGESFGVASDTVDDKEILKAKIAEAKEKIQQFKLAIEELDASESYQLIQQIDDIESYFEELKNQLEEEYQLLEKELNQLKQQPENTMIFNENSSPMTEDDWQNFLNEPINDDDNDKKNYWTEEF